MIEVREATSKDVPQIVDIHLNAFPGFFLSSLGKGFLKLYYTAFITHKDGVLLVADKDSEVIGFAAGSVLSSGFYSRIIKANFFKFALRGVGLLFTRPKNLLHVFKNMTKESSDYNDTGQYSELISIGVNPQVQRSGAGRALLTKFEETIEGKGSKMISLTTDYYDNEKALAFYKSMDYTVWYDFITYPDRKMYRLQKMLD